MKSNKMIYIYIYMYERARVSVAGELDLLFPAARIACRS